MTAPTLSSVREDRDHEPYGFGHLNLVLGRHSDGELKHVSQVSGGRACECTCPACMEPLVAKQGNVRTWHFAHANGSECREAQGAALACLMRNAAAQDLRILLPEDSIIWGRSRVRVRASRFGTLATSPIQRERSVFSAMLQGESAPIDIVFKIHSGPSIECDPGTADMLEISLKDAPSAAYTSKARLLDYILRDAPRAWLRTAAGQARKRAMREDRLGIAQSTIEASVQRLRAGTDECPELSTLRQLHLDSFVDDCPIQGEDVFQGAPKAWRASALVGLALSPWLRAHRDLLLTEAAFGQAAIDQWLRAPGRLRFSDFDPEFTEDDRQELGHMWPGYRPSSEVIDAFLAMLCAKGALNASPRKARLFPNIPTQGIEDKLEALRGRDWILSPSLARHIWRMKAAEKMLADR